MLQLKASDNGRKNFQLQDPQRQEGGGKCLWNLSQQVKGTVWHHGSKVKGCQRHYLYMRGVAQHDEARAGQIGHQIQEMCPDENYRNPLR